MKFFRAASLGLAFFGCVALAVACSNISPTGVEPWPQPVQIPARAYACANLPIVEYVKDGFRGVWCTSDNGKLMPSELVSRQAYSMDFEKRLTHFVNCAHTQTDAFTVSNCYPLLAVPSA